MRRHLRHHLYLSFPHVFAGNYPSPLLNPFEYHPSIYLIRVASGLYAVIHRLCSRLEALIDCHPVLFSDAQRFPGGLRLWVDEAERGGGFQVSTYPFDQRAPPDLVSAMQRVIDEAVEESKVVCEACGVAGETVKARTSEMELWRRQKVLCDGCEERLTEGCLNKIQWEERWGVETQDAESFWLVCDQIFHGGVPWGTREERTELDALEEVGFDFLSWIAGETPRACEERGWEARELANEDSLAARRRLEKPQ